MNFCIEIFLLFPKNLRDSAYLVSFGLLKNSQDSGFFRCFIFGISGKSPGFSFLFNFGIFSSFYFRDTRRIFILGSDFFYLGTVFIDPEIKKKTIILPETLKTGATCHCFKVESHLFSSAKLCANKIGAIRII